VARSLDFILQGAGLVPVAADVDVPVMRISAWINGMPRDTYRPAEVRPSGALADLTYFWIAECDPCKDGLADIVRLQSDRSLDGVLALRTVVVDTEFPTFFGEDARALGMKDEVLVDTQGGFAERLGVLGAPGVILSDVDGKVVARFNGAIELDSPGFELLLATLKNIAKDASGRQNQVPISLAAKVRSEVKIPAAIGVRFLGVPLTGWFFLFALAGICYAVAKSVIRLRKKPEERRKSS